MKQLVYMQERSVPLDVAPRDDVRFVLCWEMRTGLMLLPALVRAFGLARGIKELLRLATPVRKFYCVMDGRRLVAHGGISLGFCRHYEVDPDSAVIGPVMTDEQARNRGIATWALKMAINAMIARALSRFYIDTAENNTAMQRVIAKCGFGAQGAVSCGEGA